MTQEEKLEKAKVNMDYKERLEKAKELYPTANADQRYVLECLFPELAESEDERIRKEMLNVFKQLDEGTTICGRNYDYAKWIAWLEKQGETYTKKDVDDAYLKGVCDTKQELEKQGEQKLADKVEPKFKVGDWVIRSAEGFKHNTYLVTEVKDYYVCKDLKGRRGTFTFNDVHKNFKLWDISDAKDGDVLASNNSVFIFQEEYIAEKPIAYCGLMNGLFVEGEDACWTNEKYYPATKEQRDTLMKAITDAGYEWDTEKKELKKIEQKPAEWSEEDDKMLGGIILRCEKYGHQEQINWLKSLKQRIGG